MAVTLRSVEHHHLRERAEELVSGLRANDIPDARSGRQTHEAFGQQRRDDVVVVDVSLDAQVRAEPGQALLEVLCGTAVAKARSAERDRTNLWLAQTVDAERR